METLGIFGLAIILTIIVASIIMPLCVYCIHVNVVAILRELKKLNK